MTRRFLASVSCLVIAALALPGCGEARRTLGMDKQPPDEFAVAARAPLSLPPDYSLRPPQPGADRPQEGSTADQARLALTGGRAPAQRRSALSPGERAFLQSAGADTELSADIRAQIDRETSALATEAASFTDRLVFWRAPDEPGTLVDPEKESQRLREKQALGASPAEGEMPTIERGKKALLEGIF
jgi:hypothetical protein